MKKKKTEIQIRNNTAEFLIFTRQAGENGIEVQAVEGIVNWLAGQIVGGDT